MTDSSISNLTKIKVHSIKRKAPSSVKSGKQKRFKSEDTSSVISLTTAYGVRKATDESSEDDGCSSVGTADLERPCNFVKLDTSKLNRQNGVLFSEDLTDDHEIWTLQCPYDIDINTFLDQKISFDQVVTLPIKNSMGHKTDLIPYKSLNDTNITIVTPSEESSNLSLNVVPLAGTLIMSHRVKKGKPATLVSLPVDTIEDANKRRSELMSKITERLSNKSIETESLGLKKEFQFDIISPSKVKKSKKKK